MTMIIKMNLSISLNKITVLNYGTILVLNESVFINEYERTQEGTQ